MDDESTLSIFQASTFYEQFFSGASSPEIFLRDQRVRSPEKEDFPMSNRSLVMSGPTYKDGLGFQVPAHNIYREEGHPVAGFKPEFCDFIHNGNLLNFELNKNIIDMPACARISTSSKEDQYNGWKNFPKCLSASEASGRHQLSDNKGIQDLGRQDTSKNKRPMGDGVQELKKQCVVSSTKPKLTKSESTAKKDPLSIAAKNRRERISERLKALQELVPNGSKVDLVTMLEKAISYVKFLQLQVKVLATDEFWPSQGGKAPELSQVKEAIDAILGS